MFLDVLSVGARLSVLALSRAPTTRRVGVVLKIFLEILLFFCQKANESTSYKHGRDKRVRRGLERRGANALKRTQVKKEGEVMLITTPMLFALAIYGAKGVGMEIREMQRKNREKKAREQAAQKKK